MSIEEVTLTILPFGLPSERFGSVHKNIPNAAFIMFKIGDGPEVSLLDLIEPYKAIGSYKRNYSSIASELSQRRREFKKDL